MYIDTFLAGVLATIGFGSFAFVVFALWSNRKK